VIIDIVTDDHHRRCPRWHFHFTPKYLAVIFAEALAAAR